MPPIRGPIAKPAIDVVAACVAARRVSPPGGTSSVSAAVPAPVKSPTARPGGDAPREQHRDAIREDEEHEAERAEQHARNEDGAAADPVREVAEEEHGDEHPEQGRRGEEREHGRREVELPRVRRPETERHGAGRNEHRQPVDDRDVGEPPRQDGALHGPELPERHDGGAVEDAVVLGPLEPNVEVGEPLAALLSHAA